MKYAIIDENNTVVNIAVSDSPLADNWIPVTGWVDEDYVWNGTSFEPPTYPRDVEVAIKKAKFKAKRTEVIDGTISNVQVAGPEDRENIQGAIDNWETVLGNPATIDWTMADNTVQPLSKAELQAIQQQYIARRFQAHATYQSLLAQLETASDPRTVEWP